ncbi:cobaltochelatase subunit CobN [Methanococcoides sp. SA1]|nr:cobaltochelatase subunit CobN [Methanococcoides sp. SA1]
MKNKDTICKKIKFILPALMLLICLCAMPAAASSYELVANTTSDINGDFVFNDVPNGEYQLSSVIYSTAMTGMWLTNVTAFTIENGTPKEFEFAMRKNTANDHDKILSYLDRTIISGKTVSKSGSAKIGTDIILTDQKGNFIANITSDENGDFIFEDVQNGEYRLSSVIYSTAMTGMWLTNVTDFTIENGTPKEFEFAMRKNTANDHEKILSYLERTTISGRTVSKSGSAKIGTDIILTDQKGNFIANLTSDGNGDFSFEDVQNGEYRLSSAIYSTAMTGMWLTNVTEFTIENGTPKEFEFAMRKNTANDHDKILSYLEKTTISGKTVSKSGSAKADTNVLLLKLIEAETDETIPEGPNGSITLVTCYNEFISNITSDVNGNFIFDNIPNGEYQLSSVIYSTAMTGMWLTNVTDFTIENGTPKEFEFAMRKNTANDHEKILSYLERTTISGRTVSKSGSAKIGTDIILTDQKGNFIANITSDGNGYFIFEDVQNGKYRLSSAIYSTAMTGMWLTNVTEFTIENGTPKEFEFAMRKNTANDHEKILSYLERTTISGRTVSKSGSAKIGTDIILTDQKGNFIANLTSDGNGDFSFEDVQNGEYRLSSVIYSTAMTGMWLTNVTDFTIENGTPKEFEFAMRKNTANDHEKILTYLERTTISGKTVSKSGSAKPGTEIILTKKIYEETNVAFINAPHLNISFVTGYSTYDSPLNNFVNRINENSSLNITASVYLPNDVNENVDLSQQDIIYINMFTQSASKLQETIDEAIANGATVIGYNTYLTESSYNIPGVFTDQDDFYSHLQKYWLNGAAEDRNFDNLAFYLATVFGERKDLPVLEPIGPPASAIYHPEMDTTSYKFFTSNASEYFEWYSSRPSDSYAFNENNPTVGITFYKSYYPVQMETFDRLIEDFESKNVNVIACYGSSSSPHDELFKLNGSTIVDVVISFNYRGNYFNETEIGVPVINGVLNGYMNYEEYLNSSTPIPSTYMLRLYRPETEGSIDPIMIATEEIDPTTGSEVYVPIDMQMKWLVERTMGQIELATKDEADKKVAIIYYNHGGGKNNIGASYLQVIPSICNLLSAMEQKGYDIDPTIVPDEDTLVDLILKQGRNVGTWAPGELYDMVENGNVVLLPAETYEKWFSELPEQRQDEVISMWGEAPGNIMVYENTTGKYLVIPKIDAGQNVVLAPQPTRGWLQDADILYHDDELPPHHQYIAFYLWLQNEYGADAIVNMGRHGTVEWLPGKEFCLMADEWPALMNGDMPVVYPYVMDGMGEGYQAKRRGNAIIIDHLIPPVIEVGLYGNYSVLSEMISDYNVNKNQWEESIIEQHQQEIIDFTNELRIDKLVNISLSESNTTFDLFAEEVSDELEVLRTSRMPYGLHILGEAPEGDKLVGMVKSMLGDEFTNEVEKFNTSENASNDLLGLFLFGSENESVVFHSNSSQAAILNGSSETIDKCLQDALVYRDGILESNNEIEQVIKALDAKYIEPNKGGDPITKPLSLPSGSNFYSFDEMELPSEASWQLGQQLAQQMLDMYREDHNDEYPKKVAYILWAGESTRNECMMESQILYLMGMKPVWKKGDVVDIVSMTETELAGRPRIDVVMQISGLYRDTFPRKIELLDKAVKLAYEENENNNYVRQNTDAIQLGLNITLQNAEISQRMALHRIFGPADGMYGTGMANAVTSSNTYNDTGKLAELYLNRMCFVYGEDVWGDAVPREAFELNLKAVNVTTHSRSSSVYGSLDTNDFYQYLGGLNNAIYRLTGNVPDSFVMDLQDPDEPTVKTQEEFINEDLYMLFSPSFLEGQMNAGVEGARTLSKYVENIWGTAVLNNGLIGQHVWDSIYNTFIKDSRISDWLSSTDPYSYQSITGRLLEAARTGVWTPSEDVLESLAEAYQRSVVEDGISCCHHTCGNPLLHEYVSGLASVTGYTEVVEGATTKPEISEDNKQSSKAGSGTTSEAKIVDTSTGNQTRSMDGGVGSDMANDPTAKQSVDDGYVEGYEMTKEKNIETEPSSSGFSGADMLGTAIVFLAVGIMFYGFRRRGF